MAWKKTVAIAVSLVLLVLACMAVVRFTANRNSRAYRLFAIPFRALSFGVPDTSARQLPFRDDFSSSTMKTDWRRFRFESLEDRLRDNALEIDVVAESVWVHNLQGPLLSVGVSGDVTISAGVSVRKATAPDSPPDIEWQFAGIMLRDPRSERWFGLEDYLFCVLGTDGRQLAVEFKSTRNGWSDVGFVEWPSGDAELGLRREGNSFSILARQSGSDRWRVLHRYTRDDLPRTLQAGLIVYAHSEGRGRHDLRARFSWFEGR